MTFCFHTSWSFPRRYTIFRNSRDVDVETCLGCGKQRVSKVQFGPQKDSRTALHASAKLNEEVSA
jgi:hypothetical protein